MNRTRRLLSIAHSYVVGVNRDLPQEMALAGAGRWEVTAAAPHFLQGDLRPMALHAEDSKAYDLQSVPAYLSKKIHLMFFGARLRQLLRQPWDVVHCWEEPFVISGAQVAWWTPRPTPLVFTTLQNIPKPYPFPFNQLERYCLSRCAGWLACGQTVVQTLLPRGYDRHPYRVIPLGVNLQRFFPNEHAGTNTRRRLGWTEEGGPPVVGFIGRLVPEKGLELLTHVLDHLATPWRALFVGAGPLESLLRRWSHGKQDRVRILTRIPHEEVPACLNAMDVLCAPSQTTPHWREQFGRMLIEAFACGVPVIASNSGEIPFVVTDAGLLVGEKDEAGWIEALQELLQSPTRRREFSARGLERAQNHYAWPIIARQHLEFFEELL